MLVKQELTLADLQRRLDRLRPGETLTIAGATHDRLFGLNGHSRARLEHFATGHHCTVEQYDGAVVFTKTR